MSGSTDPRKLALWRERFSRFSCGESAVGRFCARERVSVASFYYWREKVGEFGRPSQSRPQADRPSAFQPVTVVPAASTVRIELPCGTRIELGTEDPEVVRTVVDALVRSSHERDRSVAAC